MKEHFQDVICDWSLREKARMTVNIKKKKLMMVLMLLCIAE